LTKLFVKEVTMCKQQFHEGNFYEI